MANEKGLRITKGVAKNPVRFRNKGIKKKSMRMAKAFKSDGWERKKAGGLSPARMTSRHQFRMEVANGIHDSQQFFAQ